MNKRTTRRKFVLGSIAVSAAAMAPWLVGGIGRDKQVMGFCKDSTAEQVTEGISLHGKTILVTGASSGLGYETTRVLAIRGAHVLAVARTSEKAAQVAASLDGKITPLACELSDFDEVAALIAKVQRLGTAIDVLVCNAGMMSDGEGETVRGIEKQFVVNYLSHFLLSMGLLPQLDLAPHGRIVLVSSGLYTKAPVAGIDFDNLTVERPYAGRFTAYGQSKLAMVLFAVEFSRRYTSGNLTANALYPGVVNTNLFRQQPWLVRLGFNIGSPMFLKEVEEGAATQCYVASHPGLDGVSGALFADCSSVVPEGPHVHDAELAARLWDTSIELTKSYLAKAST